MTIKKLSDTELEITATLTKPVMVEQQQEYEVKRVVTKAELEAEKTRIENLLNEFKK